MPDTCEQCPDTLCREGRIKELYCWRKREQHRCLDCRFCDAQNLVCYPESEDCLPMYELEEEDLVKPGFCDFFKTREQGKEGPIAPVRAQITDDVTGIPILTAFCGECGCNVQGLKQCPRCNRMVKLD